MDVLCWLSPKSRNRSVEEGFFLRDGAIQDLKSQVLEQSLRREEVEGISVRPGPKWY